MSETTPTVGNLVVLEHVHEEQSGLYRLVVGRELVQITEDGTEVVGHTGIEDFVFDDADARWFKRDGERKADKTVANEQRKVVKEVIDARSSATAIVAETPSTDQPQPRTLPGVGDTL